MVKGCGLDIDACEVKFVFPTFSVLVCGHCIEFSWVQAAVAMMVACWVVEPVPTADPFSSDGFVTNSDI